MNPQYSYGTEYYQSHKTIGYQVNIKSTNEADMKIIKSSILNNEKKNHLMKNHPQLQHNTIHVLATDFQLNV